jgi:hypothetical protein
MKSKGVVDRIPREIKGAGVGLGIVLLGSLGVSLVAPESKESFKNPLLWAVAAASGLAVVAWDRWSDDEFPDHKTAESNTIATTSAIQRTPHPALPGHVHPEYAATTKAVGQHITSFPPGSSDFADALRDGTILLDHVSQVYCPEPALGEGWQTITHTQGVIQNEQHSQDNYGRSSAALPPSAQQQFQPHPEATAEPVAADATSDTFAEWQAQEGTELHLSTDDGDSDDDLWGQGVSLNGKHA